MSDSSPSALSGQPQDEVIDARPGRFWVDDAILDSHAKTLGVHGLAVYVVLCRRAGKNGQSFPSVRRIAEDLGISERQAKRELKKLRDLKLIAIRARRSEKGRQQSSVYTVLDSTRVPVSHSKPPLQSDSEAPGGEGSVSHPKEDTESKEVTVEESSNESSSTGEPPEAAAPVRPKNVKGWIVGELMDRVTAARNRGREILDPSQDDRKKLGSTTEANWKHYEVDEFLRALDYMVAKAAGEINNEKAAWCYLGTALTAVKGGWRPKGTLRLVTPEDLAFKEENQKMLQDLLKDSG